MRRYHVMLDQEDRPLVYLDDAFDCNPECEGRHVLIQEIDPDTGQEEAS